MYSYFGILAASISALDLALGSPDMVFIIRTAHGNEIIYFASYQLVSLAKPYKLHYNWLNLELHIRRQTSVCLMYSFLSICEYFKIFTVARSSV